MPSCMWPFLRRSQNQSLACTFSVQCCSGCSSIACSNTIKPPNLLFNSAWKRMIGERGDCSSPYIAPELQLQGFLTRRNPRDILHMPHSSVHPYCCIIWHARSIMSFNACLVAQPSSESEENQELINISQSCADNETQKQSPTPF